MNVPPGLTCTRCQRSLYPRPATRTDEGWTHATPCPRTCTIEDCTRRHVARGYCRLHYGRHVLGHQPRKRSEVMIVMEDVVWMAETGETWTRACERLQQKPKTVEKYLTDQGRYELATRMKARETPLTAGSRKDYAA